MLTKNEKIIVIACFSVAGVLFALLVINIIPFRSEIGMLSFGACYILPFFAILLCAASWKKR